MSSWIKRMRWAAAGLAAGLVLLLAAPPCGAVTVYLKGQEEPVQGHLVSENEHRIVIEEVLPGGKRRKRSIPRAEVDSGPFFPVKPERLEGLEPSDAGSYRDYADELSGVRKDPEARSTAIRLYLIAAHLEPEELGRSSLLAMADLARSPAEERRFRAMGYLLDPAHNRADLRPPALPERSAPGELDAEQRQLLLKGLKALRSGRKREALNRARVPEFQELLEKYSQYVSVDQFIDEARDEDPSIPARLLKQILALELHLRQAPLARMPADRDEGEWSRIPAEQLKQPVAALDLETLTEFDPRKTLFRGGEWVRP